MKFFSKIKSDLDQAIERDRELNNDRKKEKLSFSRRMFKNPFDRRFFESERLWKYVPLLLLAVFLIMIYTWNMFENERLKMQNGVLTKEVASWEAQRQIKQQGLDALKLRSKTFNRLKQMGSTVGYSTEQPIRVTGKK
ncbi:MAG: hypothetical protein LBS50_10850 [Prevotellaceae bacterium]|jgi:hypothetical protein|nr:hypothetical protein [Prevotellaceae bacterium]